MMRFFLCLLCFIGLLLQPQHTHAQYKKKTEKLAEQLFRDGDYYNAAIYYKRLLDIDSSRPEPNYNYAQALRLSNYYDQAFHYYYKTYKMDRGKKYPDALYWMAEIYKFNHDYSKAKRYFKRAERYYRGNKSTFYYAKVKQEQDACDLAARLYRDQQEIEIENVGEGLNTTNSEFAAFMLNDSLLYYSSLRPEKDTLTNDTSYLIRIYEAAKRQEQWFTTNRDLYEVNAENYHVANGVLDTRNYRFYFTISTDSNNFEIYYSIYDNNKFSEPKSAGRKINLEGYTSTQPTLGMMNGEEVLFFVSDRPGGVGQLDIWYCTAYSNGVFSEPVNAGDAINTLGNDITPFYHAPTKTLFFSSDWHAGLGGYDIFKSGYSNGYFEEVENMGAPVNSSVNDFYFRVYKNSAVLTSNRPGSISDKSATCCNDIYELPFEYDEVIEEKDPLEMAYDELVEFLPLRLFFHNDEPNPRSRNTGTDKDYISTYASYMTLLDRYKREYSRGLKGDEKLDAEDEIVDFFDLQVKEGAENLRKFTSLLNDEMQQGRKIALTVKGFASPLSKSDYNSNLTLRRISSIENYFREYKDGVLIPYLESGQLSITQQPYGEDKASTDVSDNINDKRNSIYSKRAAFERRVEIISLTLN